MKRVAVRAGEGGSGRQDEGSEGRRGNRFGCIRDQNEAQLLCRPGNCCRREYPQFKVESEVEKLYNTASGKISSRISR